VNQVLQLSNRALEIDPANVAGAYDYDAAGVVVARLKFPDTWSSRISSRTMGFQSSAFRWMTTVGNP
jgi:hypothetical protein